MINDITFKNVLNIYENEICKNIKNKRKLYFWETNKMQCINDIVSSLKCGNIKNSKYNIFLIYEPKCRLVMSLSVRDKIINHFLARYILEKNLSKYLDMRNTATRKNMGTSYAIKLLIKYINKEKNKHDKVYALKLDISKYFYSIDHNILKNLLKEKLSNDEFELIEKVIDSTNENYINEKIDYYRLVKGIDIPNYLFNKGLPIGNMTSQFLSIFYLYKLDHYIVHDLKCKNYLRYMDDFIVIDSDLDKLRNVQKIIIGKLKDEYKLEVNPKKTSICNLKSGFSFLGYTYKIVNNKTIIKIKKENLSKIKSKLKLLKNNFNHNNISHHKAFCTVMNYSYSYIFCNNRYIHELINKCWYEK